MDHGESFANTVARASAEREEGVRMATDVVLWQEALRLELIRIRVHLRITVHSVNEQPDRSSGRYIVLSCFIDINEFSNDSSFLVLVSRRSIE